MSMSKVECEKLLERAHLMGMDAGRAASVTPMIVGSPSTPFGSDIDYSKKTYFVEGGACGFAGVVIKPARGKFVSYLKSIGIGNKHTTEATMFLFVNLVNHLPVKKHMQKPMQRF